MRKYTIDIMKEADVDEVWAIENATFAVPWSRASIARDATENPCARYVVIRGENGEILGYAGMWLVLDEAHVTNVAIRKNARGEGLGEAMMRALVQLAADSGMQCMTLECRESNAAARGLYRKLGFYDVGLRRHYYADNNESAVLMTLDDMPEGNPDNDPFLVVEDD